MFRKYTILILAPIFLLFFFVFGAYAAPPEEIAAQVEEPDGDAGGVPYEEDEYPDPPQAPGSDVDEDNVPFEDDECLDTLRGEAVNADGCSVIDICPCLGDWKNQGEHVSCVTKTSNEFVKAGLITKEEKSNYVSEAAKIKCPMPVGGPNYNNYGDPDHPPIWHANDPFEITFAVTGDPQLENMFDAGMWIPFCGVNPYDKLLASQKTVKEINESCKNADPGCMGVVIAGDLTQRTCVQEIVAFRQLFEYGYPGDDGGSISCYDDDYTKRYSWGYNLDYPMFTMIGNHDDPTAYESDCSCFDYCFACGDKSCNTTFVQDYVNDLVSGSELYKFPIEKRIAETVPNSFYKSNYAWEWGNFQFISLGYWAFYDHWDAGDRSSVDQDKVDWLKDYLAAVGHEKAIILFQHVGWDGFSLDKWWSYDNAEQLVDVLCNRDRSDEPCGTEEKPKYNVIGIFSGHTHKAAHKKICAEGKDSQGNCVGVYFDNYIVNDAGPDSNEDGTGYTMVHLNVWPEGYDRHTAIQMTVTNKNLTNFDYDYFYDDAGDGVNLTGYDLITHSVHTKTGTTTGLTTWDLGEPNGGRLENCATFKPNGRFNDLDCTTHLRFVCRETDPNNPLISELHLLTAEDAGEWEHGEFICEESGEDSDDNRAFSLPKSFEEQAALRQLIIDSADSSAVWVNYSDQIAENHWIVYPMDYFYFEPGQPNNGSQLQQDKGHGEDCAIIKGDGLLDDRRCENEMHSYVCKDDDRWYIHPEKGMWKQAFDEDKCGEDGFLFPANDHEYNKMVNDIRADLHLPRTAWISLNDITEEGNWVNTTWMQKCWGEDEDGQATLPSDTSRQISAGDDFTCGIRQDGTVKCWGNDDFGKLDAPDGVFLQISAGERHVCGVRSDKTVACWGDNEYGQASPPEGKFHQVSAGAIHSCGMRNNNTLACWGDNSRGQLDDVPSGKFSQISAGFYFTCGVRNKDKTVVCWGDNFYGQSDAPSSVEFLQVSAGQNHACGVQKDNNEVICWGDNFDGQLDAPSGTFLKIDAGYYHTCGIRGKPSTAEFEGYWKLDDGTGMIAADSSENDYDGTLGNTPTWTTDTPNTNFKNSHSLRFDRADGDYVRMPATTKIDNLPELSLSTWVMLKATPSPTDSYSVMRFITLGNEKAVLRYYRENKFLAGLQFYMNIGDSLYSIKVPHQWETGVWYHVAGTYDGSTMRLYLNGREKGKKNISGSVATGNGVTLSHSGGESLDGLLDDVQIYNWALTLNEIQALARGEHPDNGGTLACWGNNANGQLDMPSDTFDKVNAGGFHTCSIKSFIHPWEDDFAVGRKYNEDEDCAEIYTYLDNGKQTGKLYDRSCDANLSYFACKNFTTGDWWITPEVLGGASWENGFDECSKPGFRDIRFDSPVTEAGFERLLGTIWEKLGEHARVWVNYSDTRIEGLWRHAYWENWMDGYPLSGCAVWDRARGEWRSDEACFGDYLCDMGNGFYNLEDGYWFDALKDCDDDGGVMALPTSQTDQDNIERFLNALPLVPNEILIRFSNLAFGGQWEDWFYRD